MKRLTILLLASTLFILNAQSQITNGNWMIGGNVSYSSTTYKSDGGQHNTGYILQIAPDIGYFFANKLVAGLRSNINKQGTKSTGTSGYNKYTDFNIGPFVRYYFLSEDKIINIIAEGAYQYGFDAAAMGDTRGQHTSKNTFAISAGPVAYFNTAVGLEFLVSYSSYKFVNIKGRNNTVQLSLGLQVYLEKDD